MQRIEPPRAEDRIGEQGGRRDSSERVQDRTGDPANDDSGGAIELAGSARRVVRYSPWFIWGVAGFWAAFIVWQLVVTNGDWLSALRFGAPGLFIGVVLGIRFRDSQ